MPDDEGGRVFDDFEVFIPALILTEGREGNLPTLRNEVG